jgi:hypothetical protein
MNIQSITTILPSFAVIENVWSLPWLDAMLVAHGRFRDSFQTLRWEITTLAPTKHRADFHPTIVATCRARHSNTSLRAGATSNSSHCNRVINAGGAHALTKSLPRH